jgi:hypothetical protein
LSSRTDHPGQQTLAEIKEKVAHNSAELKKLRDRSPISISLVAPDIREITQRRLLTKSPEGDHLCKCDIALGVNEALSAV